MLQHQFGVLGAARLHVDDDLDLADLQSVAVPGVQHLDDVGVRLGDDLGDACQLAGSIGKRDADDQVAG